MKTKEEAISVRVTAEMKCQVQALAQAEDLSEADIGRRAFKEYIERHALPEQPSQIPGSRYPAHSPQFNDATDGPSEVPPPKKKRLGRASPSSSSPSLEQQALKIAKPHDDKTPGAGHPAKPQ